MISDPLKPVIPIGSRDAMKEEVVAKEIKAPSPHLPTLSRLRASKPKDITRSEAANGVSPGQKSKPSQAVPEANNGQKSRSLVLNKQKSGEELGVQKGREMEETRLTGRLVSRKMEQYSRPRRPEPKCRKMELETGEQIKDMQERFEESESLVKDLRSEIVGLKAQLEKLQSLNVELESQNKQFRADLSSSEAKISALASHDQRDSTEERNESLKFRDAQRAIANKFDKLVIRKELINGGRPVKIQPLVLEPITKPAEGQDKGSRTVAPLPPSPPALPQCWASVKSPPPPPPPPPPQHGLAKTAIMKKAPTLVEFYHSLNKRDGKKDSRGTGNSSNASAHSSIVGEIQNRSSHLLAIKADVETKGDFIKFLIQKVKTAAYTDIDDLLTVVEWLDRELSSLSDERAVLKHFDWPERKADAMREAAFEYRDLKQLLTEISSYVDDPAIPSDVALKKMTALLEKSEKRTHKLIKLRDLTTPSYRDYKIPTDWMLDSGIVSKIKLASVNLAKLYIRRVSVELESTRHSEREFTQEALLHQCARFAYKAHQFAGGLDAETMCAFEEIRQRVPTHWGGSRELIVGWPHQNGS